MKTKTRRNLIQICLLCAALLPTVGQAQFTFTTNNGAITITGYTGTNTVVTIPSATNGYPVTSIGYGAFQYSSVTSVTIPNSVTNIGDDAFDDCTSLTGVTIPNSVTSIGNEAFYSCYNMTSVTIGNGVTNIGDYAFFDCFNLTSVTIPNSVISIGGYAFYDCTFVTGVTIGNGVTNIGDYAFLDCSSLTAITVDTHNPAYSSVAGVLFDKNQTTLILFPGGKGGSYTIPNSVTSIGDNAFADCFGLTSMTIPNSVTNIGAEPFLNCPSLTAITVGSQNTNYSSLAGVLFNKNQTTLIEYPRGKTGAYSIPGTVTSIGYEAFKDCGLKNITIPNSVTSIGDDAFNDCSLTNVTIGTNVTSIGDSAFLYCSGLTSVTIPNSVTSIGDFAFDECSGLTSVTIGNGVTSIGVSAFLYCSGLTSVTIPNSVTSIGGTAFSFCTRLTAITVNTNNPAYSSVAGVVFNKNQTTLVLYPPGKTGAYSIPGTVTSIGAEAFYHCTSLTNVTIGNSVTSIGDLAFADCTSLTNVTIGNSVTSIGDYAFYYCTYLTSVTIPNSVTSIGNDAFYQCFDLTSVTIGNGVTNIGNYAFDGSPILTGVYFRGNAPGNGSDSSVFSGDFNAIVYYLPGTTGWGSTFDGRRTVLWNPQAQTSDASFGVRTNRFGFNITGSSNLVVVVEGCTNLANPVWLPLSTIRLNTFIGTNGTSYFSDSKWTNYSGRFYRFRSP